MEKAPALSRGRGQFRAFAIVRSPARMRNQQAGTSDVHYTPGVKLHGGSMRGLLCLCLLALCGCAERIDGSSPTAFRRSLGDVQASLSPEEKRAFRDGYAVFTIIAAFDSAAWAVRSETTRYGEVPANDSAGVNRRLREMLDGLTAEQVVLRGDSLRDEAETLRRKAFDAIFVRAPF